MEAESCKPNTKKLPLSIQMEGQSRFMTTLLEATIALWMISLHADGNGLFIQKISRKDGGWEKLPNYIIYMVVGAISGAVAVGALSLNFRPLELSTWKKRSCRAVFALVIVDLLAIDQIQLVGDAMIDGFRGGSADGYASTSATAFLTFVGVIWTIVVNVIFVRQFGWCICCRREKTGIAFIHKTQACLEDLPVAPVVELQNGKGTTVVNMEDTNHKGKDPVTKFNVQEGTSSRIIENKKTQTSTLKLNRWTTKNLIEYNAYASQPQPQFGTINEEETCEVHGTTEICQENSNSNNLQQLEQSGLDPFMFEKWISKETFKELWSILKEEPGRFQYPVWVKSSFLTSVVVLIYSTIRSTSIIFALVDDYTQTRNRIANSIDDLDDYLVVAGWQDGVNNITGERSVKLALLADDVIMDYKWTALVGYPIGMIFALCGLVAVLAQYKRMSLAVSDGLRRQTSCTEGNQPLCSAQWLELLRRYPIIRGCFFLAILSSTAVLQTQIIGTVLSVLFGLVINVTEVGFLFRWFAMYLLAYAVIFVVNNLVIGYVQSSLVSEDGTTINHPQWFNFFMVVLAMIHLVLGLLYALWRICYLLVITILILSRLDVSLFTSKKGLDNGHNAFMSMLMAGIVINQDSEHYTPIESLQTPAQPEK